MNKWIVVLATLVLAGCSKNPLLGTWVAASSSSSYACKEITFTKDREMCGSVSQEVDYEILDGAVLVKSKGEGLLGLDVTYKMHGTDLYSYDSIVTGKKKFYRRKGSELLSEQALELLSQYTPEQLKESCDNGPATVTHPDPYYSEVLPKQIHEAVCAASGSVN